MACKKESDGYDRKLQRSGQRHVKRFGAGIVGGICFQDSAFRLVIDDGRAIGCRNHFDACRIYKTHFNDYYVEKRK